MEITYRNGTPEMAPRYCDIIIKAARTVKTGVVDVKDNQSWARLWIHAVPQVWYMGKGMESLQKMREEIDKENERITTPTEAWWLANPDAIREKL